MYSHNISEAFGLFGRFERFERLEHPLNTDGYLEYILFKLRAFVSLLNAQGGRNLRIQ